MTDSEKPAPRQGNRPSPNDTTDHQSTVRRRSVIRSEADILNASPDHRHTTPTADERREAQLLAELSELGYTVAISCSECGHALTTERSKARHLGPKCAAKGGVTP